MQQFAGSAGRIVKASVLKYVLIGLRWKEIWGVGQRNSLERHWSIRYSQVQWRSFQFILSRGIRVSRLAR